jgi:Ca2+-binding EF-hand superfamily protein
MKKLSLCAIVACAATLPFAGAALAADQMGTQTGAANQGMSENRISADIKSLDKDGDNKISQQEASGNALGEYFVSIDRDGDQQVSEQELTAFAERYPSLVDDAHTEEAE